MKTPIVQFGTSRFLQAHADLFISDAMRAGQPVGPVTVVQTSGRPTAPGVLPPSTGGRCRS
jgi:tagaturonate reductase